MKSKIIPLIVLTTFLLLTACNTHAVESNKTQSTENESPLIDTELGTSIESDLINSLSDDIEDDIHDMSVLYYKDNLSISVEIISGNGYYFPGVADAVCSSIKDIMSEYNLNNCTITFLEYTEYKIKDTIAYSWKTKNCGESGIFTDDSTQEVHLDYTLDDIYSLLRPNY